MRNELPELSRTPDPTTREPNQISPTGMNYLAHLYLAEPTAEGILGSLLGDFVKGRLDSSLPAAIRRGIRLHRAIDSYTDAHPVHLASRNRVSPKRRRFAGIIVDVCYDHFLCRRWQDYSTESLKVFAAGVYEVLSTHGDELPERLRQMAPRMITQDWLCSYGNLANVGRALDGISRRFQRDNPLAGALTEVEENYDELAADFDTFFPRLVARVDQLKAELGIRDP